MQPRRVLLLGATGLVGRELLDLLLHDDAVERVRVVGRRSTGVRAPKLEEHTFELGEMERHAELFAVDAIFCALGTTMAVAKTQERFRAVDHDAPLLAARLGLQQGAQHFLLVSSRGASTRSRIFYTRVKGEVERDLLQLDYPRITIARPSFLLGHRTEVRLGERIVTRLGWLLPPSSKPIAARDVARALVAAAHTQEARVQVLESRAMRS